MIIYKENYIKNIYKGKDRKIEMDEIFIPKLAKTIEEEEMEEIIVGEEADKIFYDRYNHHALNLHYKINEYCEKMSLPIFDECKVSKMLLFMKYYSSEYDKICEEIINPSEDEIEMENNDDDDEA